ncbi:uncharacterized protein [Ptychodera flava]|uniref:uncharacterized protein n=1 Tax=Ptychodera flava TaxID=63121 RepID=UPI00396A873D
MQPQRDEPSQSHVPGQQSYTSLSQQLQGTIRNDTRPGFAKRTITGLSLCQLLLGGIAVALGITAIFIGCFDSTIACGIWCGAFFLVSGVFGLFAALTKANGLIIASMILSAVSASLFAPVLLLMSVFMIYEDHYWYFPDIGQVVLDSFLMIVAVAENVIAVISSAFCCRAVFHNQLLSLLNRTFPYGVPNERRNIQQEDPMERMGLINNPWVVSSSIQHEQQRTGHIGSTRGAVCTNAPCAIPYYQEVPGYQQRTGCTCLHRPQQMFHYQQQPSFGQPQHVHQPLSQPQINQQQHTESGKLQRPGPLQQQSQVLLTPQSEVQEHQQYQGNDITNVEGAGVNSDGNEAASAAPAEYCVNDDMRSPLVRTKLRHNISAL